MPRLGSYYYDYVVVCNITGNFNILFYKNYFIIHFVAIQNEINNLELGVVSAVATTEETNVITLSGCGADTATIGGESALALWRGWVASPEEHGVSWELHCYFLVFEWEGSAHGDVELLGEHGGVGGLSLPAVVWVGNKTDIVVITGDTLTHGVLDTSGLVDGIKESIAVEELLIAVAHN